MQAPVDRLYRHQLCFSSNGYCDICCKFFLGDRYCPKRPVLRGMRPASGFLCSQDVTRKVVHTSRRAQRCPFSASSNLPRALQSGRKSIARCPFAWLTCGSAIGTRWLRRAALGQRSLWPSRHSTDIAATPRSHHTLRRRSSPWLPNQICVHEVPFAISSPSFWVQESSKPRSPKGAQNHDAYFCNCSFGDEKHPELRAR